MVYASPRYDWRRDNVTTRFYAIGSASTLEIHNRSNTNTAVAVTS